MTALEEWKNDFKGYINELSIPMDDYKGIMEYIDEVPNETRWIPVSERLPEKSGYYLLCGKIGGHEENNYCFIGEYTPYETFGFTHDYYDPETFSPIDSEIIEYHSVIAWMLLPEPYKAESRDKE